jgi:hypothetical protein
MNYKMHYDRLIARARIRNLEGYVERHHVKPKCIDKSIYNTDIVRLLPEEHWIAHKLIIKIYPNHPGLIYALERMSNSKNGQCYNNKFYGWLRKEHIKILSKQHKGKKLSPEQCKILLEVNKGKKHTARHKQKISLGGMYKHRGENSGSCKLSDKQIKEIKIELRDKERPQCCIAIAYGVSRATISDIKLGKTRSDVKI